MKKKKAADDPARLEEDSASVMREALSLARGAALKLGDLDTLEVLDALEDNHAGELARTARRLRSRANGAMRGSLSAPEHARLIAGEFNSAMATASADVVARVLLASFQSRASPLQQHVSSRWLMSPDKRADDQRRLAMAIETLDVERSGEVLVHLAAKTVGYPKPTALF